MKKLREKLRKKSLFFLVTLVAYFVIVVALVIILIIPSFNIKLYPLSNMIIDGLNSVLDKLFNIVTAVLTLSGVVGGLLWANSKNRFNAKKLTLSILAITIPIAIIAFGSSVTEYYEPIYEKAINGTNIDSSSSPTSPSPSSDFIFSIDFSDIMFSNYTLDELNEHKTEFKTQLIEKIQEDNEDFNLNSNKSEYDDIISTIEDYETTYIFFNTNELFLNNYEERVHPLLASIDLRKDADKHYKSSCNQQLLAIRYMDLTLEEYNNEQINNSIDSAKTAISWNLTALNTQYNEQIELDSSIIDKIITSYKHVRDYSSNDDEVEKAEYLIKIFESIKNTLF